MRATHAILLSVVLLQASAGMCFATTYRHTTCSIEPLDLEKQKTGTKKDYLHKLIAIYIDHNETEKEELIESARILDSQK